jgi:hypothetical protein
MPKHRKKPVMFGNIQNGRDFVIVDSCCNDSIDYEGRIYKRLAESNATNNVIEIDTCRITHLCHAALVELL